MTRKNFIAIAKAISDSLASAPTGGTARERQAWRNGFRESAEAVAFAAVEDNPRFDYATFMLACGFRMVQGSDDIAFA